MQLPPEANLLNACRLLFGDEVDLCGEFLAYLQPDGARSAYRARAKEQHPDRFAGQPAAIRRRQTERFQELTRAYQLLRSYFLQRESSSGAPGHRHGGSYRPPAPPNPVRSSCYPHPRVPDTHLEFGLFLFHRGKITYQELIAALLWQRRQRPDIGSIARRWGWLDAARIERVLQDRSPGRRFGNRAIQLGYLNPTQVQVLLRYQQTLQQRLGQYFVERGLLETEEVEQLAAELKEHNLRVAGRARQQRWRASATR
ncbi:J domain-containing protein [Desulfuromonas carbonis]|uniref:hypothetical protein n=1 Tax=Desulfuromonas sp. DDH964 TaxID=1823759 RepID=UPI00078CFCDB|nr:hypothetical protein [Desulfuromonas sp. DDH964]AMV73307.1 hypothetical protein DBW_2999 [Desulfuromonas sp. DDH964]